MSDKLTPEQEATRERVREGYAAAARAVTSGLGTACCAPLGIGGTASKDPMTRDLYDAAQIAAIPGAAYLASLGCGNPTALTTLAPGEVVLDLGAGGGIDVLLSARRVGPTGKAYGVDMTDEMLELARTNQREAGIVNAEFLKGTIESVPLPDASVDVVISNCVINLSADKPRVLREAFRVLKPGGRFAVSDVVLRGELPPQVRESIGLWTGCVAGALHEDDFRRFLAAAGFVGIEIEPTRLYGASDIREMIAVAQVQTDDVAGLVAQVEGKVLSAFVRATKPAAA